MKVVQFVYVPCTFNRNGGIGINLRTYASQVFIYVQKYVMNHNIG